jgi:hypothetical protein
MCNPQTCLNLKKNVVPFHVSKIACVSKSNLEGVSSYHTAFSRKEGLVAKFVTCKVKNHPKSL